MMPSSHLTDDQFQQELQADTRESIEFFSNQNKSERERCVVRAFFRCLGVRFDEKDLLCRQPEPIDVSALGGRFQVTEVLTPGRRRHKEYKDQLEKLKEKSSIDGPFDRCGKPRPVPWIDVVRLVNERLSNKTACADIDALIYINLPQTILDMNSPKPDFCSIDKLGWRSVSVVYLPFSVVMIAADNAPSFIKNAVGFEGTAWPKLDGWFEPIRNNA